MSKIRIYGDTSGYIDLAAPDTADNSTLDLSTVAKTNGANTFGSPQTFEMSETGQIVLSNTGGGNDSSIRQYSDGGMRLYAGNYFQLKTNVNASISMLADSSGRVTMPNQPSFEVSCVSSGSTSTLGVFDRFDTIRHNVGGHYSTSTNRFTAPLGGRYLFTFQVFTNGGAEARMDLRVNGGRRYRATRQYSSTSFMTLNCAIIVDLNVNDYVEMYLETGEVHYNGSYSQFCGHLLG